LAITQHIQYHLKIDKKLAGIETKDEKDNKKASQRRNRKDRKRS